EPQENHRRDYRNLPREEQGRVPGEPPSSHSAEAPGSCSEEPTGLCQSSRLCQSRSSHGPRDPRTYHPPSRGPTGPRGPGPGKQPLGVSRHTPKHPAPSTRHREPQVHQRAETPTTGRWCGVEEIGLTFDGGPKLIQEREQPKTQPDTKNRHTVTITHSHPHAYT
ncbi:hypothetical protein ATANTOWER_020169, partial [Ataeniobius toweri]|nr:hypothetical protein [Ataeniobius toweri]